MKYSSFVPYSYAKIEPICEPSVLKVTQFVSGLGYQSTYVRTPPTAAKSPTYYIRVNRNMMKIVVRGQQPEHLKNKKRGQVALEFNGKARKRMLERFNSMRLPMRNVVFAHLTYPAVYSKRWQDWKENLKEFKRLLMRRFPKAVGIWKLELQKRGAPHYHMIIDLNQNCSIRRFRAWLDAAWGRIAHDLDMYGGKYACRAEIVCSIRHAMNYAAKYCSKVTSAPLRDDGTSMQWADLGATIGRQWGKIGKLEYGDGDGALMEIASLSYVRLRLALELKKRQIKWWQRVAKASGLWSLTVFGIGDDSDTNHCSALDFILDIQSEWVNLDDPVAELWKLHDELWRGHNG